MEIMKREVIDLKDRKFPEQVCFKPIGIIHTEFKTLKGIPIQFGQSESKGTIEIFPEYIPALKDLDDFSHAYCLYLFDIVKLPVPLQSKPFLDDKEHGVFAIRTPFRPNPIGLSIFEIKSIENGKVIVKNVYVFYNIHLLDIKPYIPQFDARDAKKIGWVQGKIKTKLS